MQRKHFLKFHLKASVSHLISHLFCYVVSFLGLLKSGEISCLLSHGDLNITASGNQIISWKRGKQVGRCDWKLSLSWPLYSLLPLYCLIQHPVFDYPSFILLAVKSFWVRQWPSFLHHYTLV